MRLCAVKLVIQGLSFRVRAIKFILGHMFLGIKLMDPWCAPLCGKNSMNSCKFFLNKIPQANFFSFSLAVGRVFWGSSFGSHSDDAERCIPPAASLLAK